MNTYTKGTLTEQAAKHQINVKYLSDRPQSTSELRATPIRCALVPPMDPNFGSMPGSHSGSVWLGPKNARPNGSSSRDVILSPNPQYGARRSGLLLVPYDQTPLWMRTWYSSDARSDESDWPRARLRHSNPIKGPTRMGRQPGAVDQSTIQPIARDGMPTTYGTVAPSQYSQDTTRHTTITVGGTRR
jgi:hypothetical protein